MQVCIRRHLFELVGISLATLIAFVPALSHAGPSRLEILDPQVAALPTAQTMYFPILRSGDAGYDVALFYHTIDQSAVAGVDYTFAGGPAIVPNGAPGIFAPVTIHALDPAGPNLSFSVALDSAIGVGPAPTFAAGQEFANAQNAGVLAAIVADFNGDRKPDLAFAYSGPPAIGVRMNGTLPGSASVSLGVEQTFALGIAAPSCIVAGDVNGDGRTDLVVCHKQYDSVSVLLNTTPSGGTAASFSSPLAFATGSAPVSAALMDIDNDGRLDIAVTNSADQTVSVLMNTTAAGAAVATFSAATPFAVGTYPASIAAADINGDGLPDLVVANLNSNTVSILLNTSVIGSGTPQFEAQQLIDPAGNPVFVTTGDVDNDGRPDIIVAHGYLGVVYVFRNTTLPGSSSVSVGPDIDFLAHSYPTGVTAFDLNNDGKLDLVVSNSNSNNVSVLRNTTVPGSLLPYFEQQRTFGTGDFPASVVAADMNGDGRGDLIVANRNGRSVSVLLNTTEPDTATRTMEEPVALPTGVAIQELGVADMNGDGKPDVVVADIVDSEPSVRILLNATPPGAAAAQLAAQQLFDAGANTRSLALADMNHDGLPDVVVANGGGTGVSILLNTTPLGSATLSFGQRKSIDACTHVLTLAVADFDLDGRKDLAVMCQTDGLDYTASVLFNNTSNGSAGVSFGAPQTFPGGALSYLATTMDVNGDGRPDLVSVGSLYVEVYVNNSTPGSATASFAPPLWFKANSYPTAVVVTDINADGVPDLALSTFRGAVVLINTTPPGAATPSFAPSTTTGQSYPRGIAAADLNGDGRPDLIVGGNMSPIVAVLPNTTVPGSTVPSFAQAIAYPSGNGPVAVAAADLTSDGSVDIVAAASSDGAATVLVNSTYRATRQKAMANGTITREVVFANGFD